MSRIFSLWLLIQEIYPALSLFALVAAKVSVAFLVASGLSHWARRRSALVRTWFWRVGFCGMLAILAWVLAPRLIQGIQLPLSFKADDLELPADIGEVAEYSPQLDGQSDPWTVQPQNSRAQYLALQGGRELPPWIHPGDIEYLRLQMQHPFLGWLEKFCLPLWLWIGLFLSGWKVTRAACGLVWLRRHSRMAADELQKMVTQEARQLQMTHTPVCRVVPGLSTPLLTGFFGTVVWLPEGCSTWPRQTVQFAIQHELAHAQRRDGIWQWIGHLTACAWWWHPLAWRSLNNLRSETEFAADEMVARQTGREPDYAQALLEIARSASTTAFARPTTGVAMLGMSEIGRRVTAILDENSWKGHLHSGGKWLAVLALCGLIGVAGLCLKPAVVMGNVWVTPSSLPLSHGERGLAQKALTALRAKHEQLRYVDLEVEHKKAPKKNYGVAMKWPNASPKVLRHRTQATMDTWTGVKTVKRADLVEKKSDAPSGGVSQDSTGVWVAANESLGWSDVRISSLSTVETALGFHHEYELMRILQLLLDTGKPNSDGAMPPYLLKQTTHEGRQALTLTVIKGGGSPLDALSYTTYVVDLDRGMLMRAEIGKRDRERGEEILEWELVEPSQNADGIWYPHRYRWGNRWEDENVEVTHFTGTKSR